MISHGTQKITALRRGTWQITSMTRGTFAIFGKFRGPYSLAATMALKAAFPTQWETIRDYGFAHPEIVPYVNEDYLFVCSLGLPGMPIRFLVSNNAEYINTGIYNANGFHVKVKAYCISTRNAFSPIACMSNVPSDTQRNYFGLDSSQRLWAGWGQYEWNQGSANTNQVYDFEFNSLQGSSDKYLYVDGVQQFGPGSSSYQSDSSITNVMLFARVTSGSVARHFYGGIGTAYFYDNNGNEIEVLAPFIDKVKGNVYIDLISGNIKQNANSQGAFSIGYMKKLNGQWVTWTPAS